MGFGRVEFGRSSLCLSPRLRGKFLSCSFRSLLPVCAGSRPAWEHYLLRLCLLGRVPLEPHSHRGSPTAITLLNLDSPGVITLWTLLKNFASELYASLGGGRLIIDDPCVPIVHGLLSALGHPWDATTAERRTQEAERGSPTLPRPLSCCPTPC